MKQVDRLISNEGIKVWALFSSWVAFVIGARDKVIVALDWTEFDADDQSTISLNRITRHGRATPLMWMTGQKSTMENQRNGYKDKLSHRFREVVPDGVSVTILADRGFGDTKFYQEFDELKFDYIIRFRGNITATNQAGESKLAEEWTPLNGRAKKIINLTVTVQNIPVSAVVVVHAAKMKEPWCLVCSKSDMDSQSIVKTYGRTITIEGNFWDTKDIHFGMVLSSTRISKPTRRDRLLLISALSVAFYSS